MARCAADVAAQLPLGAAGLRALLAECLARPGVTYSDALVPSARQWLLAGQAARELLHVARHRLPELVFAVAPSLRQYGAGRAGGLAVTVVQHLVGAGMRTRARPIAHGSPRAARHRRVDHLGAALAVQLVEAALQAGRTSS